MRSGVVSSRATAADRHWDIWLAFSDALGIDPGLQHFHDPVPVLQVFAARYRDGRLAPGGLPVRARTVEDALRSVGQMFASLGTKDIRKDSLGAIDFRLQRQLRSYGKDDPAPDRVKPIPIQVLFHALGIVAHTPGNPAIAATADMAVIAFFFLLRPGEYTGRTNSRQTTPFTLADVQLFLGSRRLDLATATPAELSGSTAASLTFTTQKSGVRGEIVNHGRSGSPMCCPTRAIARRVIHLRAHHAPGHTPLATYFLPLDNHPLGHPVTAANISDLLRTSVRALGPTLGLLPQDVSARSLRAGGAMALLCANVDSNVIRLLGRWHSDVMLRYLHIQAQPIMRHFASKMLSGGNYSLQPGQDVPAS